MTDPESDDQRGYATMSIAQLADLCRAAAMSPAGATGGYRPVAPHIFFFALVWLVKRKVPFEQPSAGLVDSEGLALDRAEVQTYVQRLAAHLSEWGATVTALQRRVAPEWELLRFQMQEALVRYNWPVQDKDDALQDALLKFCGGLDRMPAAATLDAAPDLVALVVERRGVFGNLYDFSSPLYAYARRIAQNELLSQMRQANRRRSVSWEELAETPEEPTQAPQDPEDGDAQTAFELAQQDFRVNLQRLLNEIDQWLAPGQRAVVLATLATRPQFWRALEVAGLAAPDGVTKALGLMTDGEIAQRLRMTENNVRSQRSQARRRIEGEDAVFGRLLERLMAAHRTK
jgi:DNA-directed RNA polymerase specialized sigma24 family protein